MMSALYNNKEERERDEREKRLKEKKKEQNDTNKWKVLNKGAKKKENC